MVDASGSVVLSEAVGQILSQHFPELKDGSVNDQNNIRQVMKQHQAGYTRPSKLPLAADFIVGCPSIENIPQSHYYARHHQFVRIQFPETIMPRSNLKVREDGVTIDGPTAKASLDNATIFLPHDHGVLNNV